MKRNVWMLGLVGFCVVTAMLGTMTGCGGGDGDAAEGTGTIQGTVESFEASVPAALVLAAVQGVTVYLDGPVSRSTTTDANGTFSFTGLPAGDYTLAFEYNGEEVTYRGQSGQEATISVGQNQTVEVTEMRISGGHVNIGNISVTTHEAALDMTGTWTISGNVTSGSPRPGGTGTIQLIQSGNTITGNFVPNDGRQITGSVDANSITLLLPCGDPNDPNGPEDLCTGTVSADFNQANGTWWSGDGSAGTWSITRQ